MRTTKSTSRTSARGFTIIELMVVVAIMGVLASIAMPSFRSFLLKTKRTERLAMVQSFERAVKAAYAERGRFPTPTAAGSELTTLPNPPGPPTGKKQAFNRTVLGWNTVSAVPEGGVYYQYHVMGISDAVRTAFFITATADLDMDGAFSVYQVEFELSGSEWVKVQDAELGDDW